MEEGGRDGSRAKDLLSKATRNRLNVKCPCVLKSKGVPKGLIVKGHKSPAVDVNRVCWNIKVRKRIAKHRLVFAEDVPVFLAKPITDFLVTSGGKFERPRNVGVQVTNIQQFPERQ